METTCAILTNLAPHIKHRPISVGRIWTAGP